MNTFYPIKTGLIRLTSWPVLALRLGFLWMLLLNLSTQVSAQSVYWQTLDQQAQSHQWRLNTPALLDWLEQNPSQFPIPLPEGGQVWARLRPDNQLIPDDIQRKYPELLVFRGELLPPLSGKVSLDFGPNGLHLNVWQAQGDWAVYPDDNGTYTSSRGSRHTHKRHDCLTMDKPFAGGRNDELEWLPIGDSLLTYRIAIAATGEYTSYFDGDKARAMAAIVTTLNRLNPIFERDLSIQFRLAEGSDTLIFDNPDTDPFGGDLLLGNTDLFNRLLGKENYDLGHVFDLGQAGAALVGSVCDDVRKAGGFSSSRPPVGDPFDLDYVAHEIGHQLGAEHTFNNCGFIGPVSFEPESGTTIMSYAGICGDLNLADGVDSYFHAASQIQIARYTRLGTGRGCAASVPTGNAPPLVTIPIEEQSIPMSTPFELSGQGMDISMDSLSYCWEEWDLGPKSSLGNPIGNAPIFRSFPPQMEMGRTFPRIDFLLGIDEDRGERLPDYGRDLNFRLTVRDQEGGVGSALLSLKVIEEAGPFLLTTPEEKDEWISGLEYPVEWDVANTDAPPIALDSVWILLSSDGGDSFGDTLAKVPNTGVATVVAPIIDDTLSNVLLKVKAAGKVFFSITNGFFQLLPDQSTSASSIPAFKLEGNPYPNPANRMINLPIRLANAMEARVILVDILGRNRVLLNKVLWPAGKNLINIPLPDLPDGRYWIRVLDSATGKSLSWPFVLMNDAP